MPFEARPLPEMIDLNGEIVAGPFCKHCGYPFTLHGPHLECRLDPNGILGPACDCHTIRLVDVRRGRRTTRELRLARRL
jgi:hypothetical protein